ncbi:hypothetical protein DRQ09_09220, partial [candidate division KSB1 bacterium]
YSQDKRNEYKFDKVGLTSKKFLFLNSGVTGKRHLSFKLKQSEKYRSIPKAVLYSGIFPGGGEFYNHSYFKAIVFSGVEVIFWVVYLKYKDKGNDIDKEFKKFADEHWREDVYKNWLEAYKEDHNGEEPPHFTHTLPDTKTQQYYEMIGKYEQFLIGWDDVTDYGQISKRRLYYMDRRGESNKYLKRASYIAMGTILNRIVSMFDSAIAVRNYNIKVKSHISVMPFGNYFITNCTISMNW